MSEFTGEPFQYNPSITNVNIDNQLAGILSQFDDDYIMDIVKDAIQNRFRLYSLPAPNIITAFETTFKQLTDGFSSSTKEINGTRTRIYRNIIMIICEFYNLEFTEDENTDYYSAAYFLYDFLVANFTEQLKNFYAMFLINERNDIYSALELDKLQKNNDSILSYSKKIFKDPKLAAIHCNIEYVISQIDYFNITLSKIVSYIYQSDPNTSTYILNLISDKSGTFFNTFYQNYAKSSFYSADILTYIKLSLQQLGNNIEPIK